MSQRIFRTFNCDVLTGWDVPLQYFFLVIEQMNRTDERQVPYVEGEETHTVFSNLDLLNPAMSLIAISEQLNRQGLIPPRTLFDDLLGDQATNDGGRYEYGSDCSAANKLARLPRFFTCAIQPYGNLLPSYPQDFT